MRALLLLLSAPSLALGQSPAMPSQNPSPMVEHTRAHTRIPQRELAGMRRTFDGPGGKPVNIFVPAATRNPNALNVLVHFHGAAFLPEHAVTHVRDNHVAVTMQLGSGSGIYDRTFSEPGAFDSLMVRIRRAADEMLGKRVRVRSLTLSGFSAGHGAIRAILRDSARFDAVDAVLLLDGMHTSYEPERTVVAEGGKLNPVNLAELLSFARAAAAGRKRMLITHSEIFPGTFASTTETANYLLDSLGLKRKAVLQWGPGGMQQTSSVRRGRFAVLGFAGNTAPDHVDHFHGMYHFLKELKKLD